MTLSLYDITIPAYQQTLGAISGLLGKAEAFCTEKKLAPADLIQARLVPDMLPFAYQVKSTVVHSIGAIEAVRKGTTSPDMTPPPDSFAALQAQVAAAIAALEKVSAAEVNGFTGRDVRFAVGDHKIDFTAENFLLSFEQPNFYFHATTAYDILRSKGVQIGKRDFMGKLRAKA
ncbi:MAG: DUF1993 domain-containing protein [Steroidobacteraceae bacterium]